MVSTIKLWAVFRHSLTLILFWVGIGLCDKNLEVSLNVGVLRGSILQTRDVDDIISFRGIPYAEAPVQQLRFKPAVPKQPWQDVLDATKDGPICPQNANKQLNMSEDCLNLNVYTKNQSSSQPVLVYIHGGGLFQGSGHSDLIGPEYLLEHDIVLVTINYRLGILGFIATDTAEAPGNLGFKDQVLALKWVQDNIRQFGGDPKLVTICGWSAGAISVGAQLISPMSKGLFQRAILMSGSAIEVIPPMNYRNTQRVGEFVGCPLNDSLVECLRYKSIEEILDASKRLDEFGTAPVRKWNVVVEKKFGQERFAVETPNEIIRKGQFHKVPIMGGWVSGEYVVQAHEILSNTTLLEKFNMDRYATNPIPLLYTREGQRSRNITDILRATYANGEHFSKNNFNQMQILFGDAVIRFRMKRFFKIASQYQEVYVYSNSYVGRYSNLYYPDDKPYATSHGDDLQYIFYQRKGVAPLLGKSDPENLMVEKMTGIWVNFAKEGIPFANHRMEWVPSNKTNIQVYDLSGDQSSKDFEKFIKVWQELYPEI